MKDSNNIVEILKSFNPQDQPEIKVSLLGESVIVTLSLDGYDATSKIGDTIEEASVMIEKYVASNY